MMKSKQKIIVLRMVLLCITVSGCGKTKATDEASSQVIQISLAPVNVTPTPDPDQINADAVTTNGNLTMVNGYLAEQDESAETDTSDSGNDNSADVKTGD